MMTNRTVFSSVAAMLVVLAMAMPQKAQAVPISLDSGFGGSDTETVTNVTLGNEIVFEFRFADVTYVSGPWIGLNASVINPLLGAFPVGQFNTYQPSTTGWAYASIDTSSGIGSIHDLAFTANTFGTGSNRGVIEIRNVAVDGQIIAAQVPEPAVLALMGLGLTGLGFMSCRRKVR